MLRLTALPHAWLLSHSCPELAREQMVLWPEGNPRGAEFASASSVCVAWCGRGLGACGLPGEGWAAQPCLCPHRPVESGDSSTAVISVGREERPRPACSPTAPAL